MNSTQIKLIVILLIGSTTGWGAGCDNCHKDPKYFVEDEKVFNYYQEWLQSPHKQADLSCSDCHGGNPQATDMKTGHEGIFTVTDPRSKVNFRNLLETCGRCHESQVKQFVQSDHYKSLAKSETTSVHAPVCTTCHHSMNRRQDYKVIVDHKCRFCHYEDNPGELPTIGREIASILNQLNISRGYLNWTKLYYKSKDWPENSKTEMDRLNAEYHEIVAGLHSFRLRTTEQSSIKLLTALKRVFAKISAEEDVEENANGNKDKKSGVSQ